MAKLAEVLASAFASGMTWAADAAGHPVYCPPPGAPLAGDRLMEILERFIELNPDTGDNTYGLALSASLRQGFPVAPIENRFPGLCSATS
jgi:hypothetical protein